MQAGSAWLHCAFAGKHLPLLQNSPALQVMPAQAVGRVWTAGALQVPSGWQVPSPQSASGEQRAGDVPMLQESSVCGSQCWAGLPLPDAAATKSSTAEKNL